MERTVWIAPDRLARWVANFAERHGDPITQVSDALVLIAPDGAIATLRSPFPGWVPGTDPVASLTVHAATSRRVGILLVRKSAHAVAIAEGRQLIAHAVERHYVQGRTKAGGWSQQRYARRRKNQAAAAYAEATEDALRILLPTVDTLDALVTGGDATAVDLVLADWKLAPLRKLHDEFIGYPVARVVPVPDPRLSILTHVATHIADVEICLNHLA